MKSVNRKILFSLLGFAVATLLVGIALIVGLRATALADSLQGDLLVVVLGLASVVASLGEGHIGLKREIAPARCDRVEVDRERELSGLSTLNPGY
jgi:Na+/proline symporter